MDKSVKKSSICILSALFLAANFSLLKAVEIPFPPQKADVLEVICKANDYWQKANPSHGNSFWNRAAYHTGNIAAYEVTNDPVYLGYSIAWAEKNQWSGVIATSANSNKSQWNKEYSENQYGNSVLFGDWQICFQVFIDLYNLDPSDKRIARAREVMDYQISTASTDYWWWADGLFMVMPVMTRMYKITKNPLYLEKLHEYWQYANTIMYDENEGIYYRDSKYVYPAHKTPNGKKDFWARGNGWVFAAFARVLADLPEDDLYRDTYIAYYQRMAEKLAGLQTEEGYWSRSLMDKDYASGYETSGTAFFTYGYLWGIANGYLAEKEYEKTVEKAWNYLTTIALQDNGKIGYVQPIGENASQHTVNAETTADFGVGAFLLAASEMYKYAEGDPSAPTLRLSSAGIVDERNIKAVFNEVLDGYSARNISNYSLNGQTIDGEVEFDGDRTITITLTRNLDYGPHTFAVKNLVSKAGAVIANNVFRNFYFPVPLDEPQEGIVVTAIGNQSGNGPEKTVDNNLNTRWSQEGSRQWIKYKLSEEKSIYAVDIAFYMGDQRLSYFDIELSTDDINYTPVLINGVSGGMTSELERFSFTPQNARYIRLVCSGNSTNAWSSLTEVRIRYTDPSVVDQTPPYWGTIFIEPGIVTSSDLSTFRSSTYAGRGQRTVYDRRTSNWESINAYLFDIVWNDGLTTEAIINPEFGSQEAAAAEAEKYGVIVGQLPHLLRTDVKGLWIHKGVEAFGGGNYSILIHTGQTELYEKDGILEETLIHEATHTSLDARHASAEGWKNAQKQDGNYISTYAKDNPAREDLAESFLLWLAVRHLPDRISETNYNTIIKTIPNRLAYLDKQNFNLKPLVTSDTPVDAVNPVGFSIYPNPVKDQLEIRSGDVVAKSKVSIHNTTGKIVYTNSFENWDQIQINMEGLQSGVYFVTLSDGLDKHVYTTLKK